MKHGKTGTRLYRIWKAMKTRCYNRNSPRYNDYGGRGIAICKEWLANPALFFEWAESNGYDDNLTIDRINVNKGYSPENCRWATKKDQNNNRRGNRLLTVHGITKSIAQWAEETGVNQFTLYDRQENGWSEDEMFAKPYTIRHEGGKV